LAARKATDERLCELDKGSPLAPTKLLELATSAYLIGKDIQPSTFDRGHLKIDPWTIEPD